MIFFWSSSDHVYLQAGKARSSGVQGVHSDFGDIWIILPRSAQIHASRLIEIHNGRRQHGRGFSQSLSQCIFFSNVSCSLIPTIQK